MVKLSKEEFLARMKKGKKDAAKKRGGGKKKSKKVRRLSDPDTIIGKNFGKLKKQVSGWKNKTITMPMKNGKPYKKGDKPPYTYKKYNYKVKLGKKNNKGIWLYDSVMLQKEAPINHINEMIAAWSIFEVITPTARYSYYGKK